MDRPEAAQECAADPARVRDRVATRRRIPDSARELFTTDGYTQVSSRRIAARGGERRPDQPLLRGKAGPSRGDHRRGGGLSGGFEGDPATLARRIAEKPAARVHGETTPLQRALDGASGDPDLKAIYDERLKSAILEPLEEHLGGADARVRASSVATVVLAWRGCAGSRAPPHSSSATGRS